MNRWTSPSTGRYSDGWWPRIVWPHCIYGNLADQVIDVRDFQAVDLAALVPAVRDGLLAVRKRPANMNATGDVVAQVGATLQVTFADPQLVPVTVALPTDGWYGDGVVAYRRGEPWLWTMCTGGPNEQVFAYGRPMDGDPRGIFIEMPSLNLQAEYDPATDSWTLAGSAMGNHGTPDYQDGVLHIVTGVPAGSPRTTIAPLLTTFDFPIRLPDEVADVWTFGDDVTGTIGGGSRADRPNRQGIGLWPDGKPWLDLDRPILGVWISPYDAQQGLRMFRDEAHFVELIKAYRVEAIGAELLAGYREQRAAGGWNFDALEERIAIEVCRRTGCSLTIYDDHVMQEVPGSEGTRYRPELLARAFGLQRQGLGVVMAIRTYPDGQAGWSFEDCARALAAGPNEFTDQSGRPKTGFDWLQMLEPENQPMPVVFTLARYTQHGNWAPTGVARRLEEMVRTGQHAGVIGYDVFGVGRGGESAEWNAWADRWLQALLARARGDVGRWPTTPTAPPPPPPDPGWDENLEALAQAIEARAHRIRDRHDD